MNHEQDITWHHQVTGWQLTGRVAGLAAHPRAPVSCSGDAGVTPWGTPVRLRYSAEQLLEAISGFCNGGFCAGVLPNPAENKTALKVAISARQVLWLVAEPCCVCPGWVVAAASSSLGTAGVQDQLGASSNPLCVIIPAVIVASAGVWVWTQGYLQLEDESKLFPTLCTSLCQLPAQWCVLKSFLKICYFPVFPFSVISLSSFFPSFFFCYTFT